MQLRLPAKSVKSLNLEKREEPNSASYTNFSSKENENNFGL